jgi:hypothetical protein
VDARVLLGLPAKCRTAPGIRESYHVDERFCLVPLKTTEPIVEFVLFHIVIIAIVAHVPPRQRVITVSSPSLLLPRAFTS